MYVVLYNLRKRPRERLGSISIRDGKLVADPGLESFITEPAGLSGQLVVPAPTEEFLNALVLQYRGSGIAAIAE